MPVILHSLLSSRGGWLTALPTFAVILVLAWAGPAGPLWALVTATLLAATAFGLGAATGTLVAGRGAWQSPITLFEITLAADGARRVARVASATREEALALAAHRSGGAQPVAWRPVPAATTRRAGVVRLGRWVAA